MRVRYPNGQVIQYNDATTLKRTSDGWGIYARKGEDKDLVCFIQNSAGAIVEWVTPCKVENPIANVTGVKALQYVLDHIEELSKYPGETLMKQLKQKLQKYSTRSGRWA